jgi:hypothetical protein
LHSAGVTHPSTESQVCPFAQSTELGTLEHVPPAQESTVQDTSSLQSVAEQQEPQLAVPPASQHCSVAPQSGDSVHVPSEQTLRVQGFPSSHCESEQHWAQPDPGQQMVPSAHGS